MKVSRILSTKPGGVITISPDKTMREAVARLVEYNIGALIVVDQEEQVVGIVTERDLVRWSAKDESVLSKTVEEVMTRRVIFSQPQDDLLSVAHTMTENRFRHLPVMDKGKLIGIISIGDVLKAQRDEYQGEIDSLQTQIMAPD